MQQMDLIRVKQQNVLSINAHQACFTTEQLLKDYPDVFEGNGKLEGQYKLQVEEVPHKWFIPQEEFLKGKLKQKLDCLQSLDIQSV